MQVWQRGTSPSTTTSYQTVDRFRWDWAQGTITQSQLALTSGSPYDEGFRYAYRATCTSNTANTNAYVQCNQEIEAQNIANSGWNYKSASSYITLSFWARSSLAGTYYTQLRTIDGSEYIYYKAFTLSADTWTKVTCTIPGNSNLQFDNDNEKGLRVLIVAYYGTDFTGGGEASSETWYSRSSEVDAYLATNFAQNWANTSSATFDVTGVQLERGTVATPFEHRSYGDELRRCMRYYYKTPSAWFVDTVGSNYNNLSTKLYAHHIRLHVPVSMRADPTIVIDSVTVGGSSTDVTTSYGVAAAKKEFANIRNSSSNYSTSGDVFVSYTLKAELY